MRFFIVFTFSSHTEYVKRESTYVYCSRIFSVTQNAPRGGISTRLWRLWEISRENISRTVDRDKDLPRVINDAFFTTPWFRYFFIPIGWYLCICLIVDGDTVTLISLREYYPFYRHRLLKKHGLSSIRYSHTHVNTAHILSIT